VSTHTAFCQCGQGLKQDLNKINIFQIGFLLANIDGKDYPSKRNIPLDKGKCQKHTGNNGTG